MRPPAKAYLRKIYKKFAFLPTWLPNQPMAPGDVGTLDDGRFQRFTDLASLGIPCTIREGSTATDLEHREQATTTVDHSAGATAAGIKGKVHITFEGEDAFVFEARGCVELSLDNLAGAEQGIVALAEQGRWDRRWVLVHKVIRAASTTAILSHGRSGSVDLAAAGPIPTAVPVLASAGLAVANQSGELTTLVSEANLTPLFQAMKLRRPLVGRDRLDEPLSFSNEPVPSELALEDVGVEEL